MVMMVFFKFIMSIYFILNILFVLSENDLLDGQDGFSLNLS